uniref:ERF1 domain-containing protein n=1 Tax=Meloidogyne javanica TaxID=6303 RepID=A0A915MJS3_MELJA
MDQVEEPMNCSINLNSYIDNNILAHLAKLEFPGSKFTKAEMKGISSIFDGSMTIFSRLTHHAPSMANAITTRLGQINNWPRSETSKTSFTQAEQNLLIRKDILIEMFEFLKTKILAATNMLEICKLEIALDILFSNNEGKRGQCVECSHSLLKAEVDKLFDNVLSPLKTFKSPKRSWGKNKLIESSSQFIGIFAMLQNFANIMPTFAADINDMETNLMTRKKLLVDMLEFLQEKAKALENKKELSDLKLQIKCVVIASPGFLREQFMEFFWQYVEKEGLRQTIFPQKSKFILVHSSSGFKHSLNEVLSDVAVSQRLSETKAQAEVKALNTFLELMCTDPQRAVYGYKHVIYAREQQSIETLMV